MSPATAAVNVTGIARTTCPVRNLRRARAFYEGQLGLRAAATFERGRRGWVEYRLGNGVLIVTNRPEDGRPSARGPLIALRVRRLDEAVHALWRAGRVAVADPVGLTSFRFVLIADPDGNRVMLYEREAPLRHETRCLAQPATSLPA